MVSWLKHLLGESVVFVRNRDVVRPENPLSPTAWLDSVIVIDVPARSDSLHFRAYAERVEARSMLHWVVQRLRRAAACQSSVYLLVDQTELQRVKSALAGEHDAEPCVCSGLGDLHDIERLARKAGKARVLLVDLSAALLPIEAFDRLQCHHAMNRHHATVLAQPPCSVAPILVETKLLSRLARTSGLPRSVRLSLAGIQRQGSARGSRHVRIGYFTPYGEEEQTRRRWPYTIQLYSIDDVEILQRAAHRCVSRMKESQRDVLDEWATAAQQHYSSPITRDFQSAVVGGQSQRSRHQILYAQGPSAFTGVEQMLVQLAKGILADRCRLFGCAALIALPGTLTDRLAQMGAMVNIPGRNFTHASVENYRYCHRELAKINPAIVHAHTFAGMPFCCAVSDRGVPFLQHVHVASEQGLMVLRDQIWAASEIIAVSHFVKGRLIRLGIDANRIHVVYNGTAVDASVQRHAALARVRVREALGVPKDARVVLVAARFAANKRHDVVVEAFSSLRSRCSNTYLLLAGEALPGDQPVFEAAKERIQRCRVQDYVRFVGFWKDMVDLYAAADIFLLPSENDPFPLAPLEAMALGVPVVAARSGGVPEMIRDGESGRLIEPGYVEGFAQAMRELFTEPDFRSQLIETAYARCKDEFSTSRFVDQIKSIYQSVVAD